MADKETKTTTKKPEDKSTDKKTTDAPAMDEKVEVKTTPKKEESPITPPPVNKLPSESRKSPTTPTSSLTPTPAPDASNTLITEPAADAAPAASAQSAPNDPVVISEKDVKNPVDIGGSNEKLAEEIEVLTGEIQALESKIERLTDGATTTSVESGTVPTESGDVAPINAPPASVTKDAIKDGSEKSKSEKKPEVSISPKTANMPTENDFVNKPNQSDQKPPASAVAGAKIPKRVNDISAKPKPNETPTDLNPSNENNGPDNTTGLAIIAEVIAVFGVIIFVILAISPFFKEIVGNNSYQAIQQIGWLSAIGALALGLILYMFVKGSGLFKVLTFILLLIASIMFLAINDNSLVTPILGSIDPLIDFYR